jgi:hypothetical protein
MTGSWAEADPMIWQDDPLSGRITAYTNNAQMGPYRSGATQNRCPQSACYTGVADSDLHR